MRVSLAARAPVTVATAAVVMSLTSPLSLRAYLTRVSAAKSPACVASHTGVIVVPSAVKSLIAYVAFPNETALSVAITTA